MASLTSNTALPSELLDVLRSLIHQGRQQALRAVYLTFPIWNAVRSKLSWVHDWRVLHVSDAKA